MDIVVTDHLSADADLLRSACFPGPIDRPTSADEFDDRSQHVEIRDGTCLAAYGRLTPGPMAYFQSWTDGTGTIPDGPDCVDLGRCCVAPSYRGRDLIILVCLEAMIRAADDGFKTIIGAVVPGRRLEDRLLNIGFVHSGTPVTIRCPNGQVETIQPLIAETAEQLSAWCSHRDAIWSTIELANNCVNRSGESDAN